LSDPQKRAVYDQVGGDPEQRGGGGPTSSGMGGMHMRPGYNHMFFDEEINPEGKTSSQHFKDLTNIHF
jgi:DnaJ-class molecular chaperone